tara:strand:- start:1153 stop:1692 length:540 start_codon:yes stop_codon:yes gene_type:complete
VQIEKISAYLTELKGGSWTRKSDNSLYELQRVYENGLIHLEANISAQDTVFIEYIYEGKELKKEVNFGLGYIDTLFVNSWNEYGKALTYKNSAVRRTYKGCNLTVMVLSNENQKTLKSRTMLYQDNFPHKIEFRIGDSILANETVYFTNYIFDKRKNWTSRIIVKPEDTYMEVRTLIYE